MNNLDSLSVWQRAIVSAESPGVSAENIARVLLETVECCCEKEQDRLRIAHALLSQFKITNY